MGKTKRRNNKKYSRQDDETTDTSTTITTASTNGTNTTTTRTSSSGVVRGGSTKKQKQKNPKKKTHGRTSTNTHHNDYSFRQKVENNGEREIIEMASDGNCLFRSISHQLYNDYGQKHDLVRHEICNYLQENEDDFKVYLLLGDNDDDDVHDFDEYVKQMRLDGQWGGDVEIVCAARLYKRAITIFSNVGAYNISIDNNDDNDKVPSTPNMLLSYHENSHYNSVHDRSNKYYSHMSSLTNQDETNNSVHSEEHTVITKKKSYKQDKAIIKHYDKETNNNDNDSLDRDYCHKDSNMHNETLIQNESTHELIFNSNGEDVEIIQKSNKLKKNDACLCGSGLRYKKCCLAKEKNQIRLEKFRQKNGININQGCDRENRSLDSSAELEGGFAILNI